MWGKGVPGDSESGGVPAQKSHYRRVGRQGVGLQNLLRAVNPKPF